MVDLVSHFRKYFKFNGWNSKYVKLVVEYRKHVIEISTELDVKFRNVWNSVENISNSGAECRKICQLDFEKILGFWGKFFFQIFRL